MSNLAILPTPLARATRAAVNPRNASTYGLYDIAGRLGQAHRKPKYLCDTIDALIAGASFPKPFPLRRPNGLSTAAHADSRWPRVAVDLWFDGQLPPEARTAGGPAERIEVDSRLSANLVHLFDQERVA